MDLKCEFAVVDVVSSLGTEQNVSSHVTKWHVDGDGIRQRYQGRNKQQKDIDLFDSTVTRTLEELHENGQDAMSLTEETFQFALHQQEYLFVDFYASWWVVCFPRVFLMLIVVEDFQFVLTILLRPCVNHHFSFLLTEHAAPQVLALPSTAPHMGNTRRDHDRRSGKDRWSTQAGLFGGRAGTR